MPPGLPGAYRPGCRFVVDEERHRRDLRGVWPRTAVKGTWRGRILIGIDELAIRKGHVYRIVVSDLEREQPIWFGGIDRSEESLAMFYDFLGESGASAFAWR